MCVFVHKPSLHNDFQLDVQFCIFYKQQHFLSVYLDVTASRRWHLTVMQIIRFCHFAGSNNNSCHQGYRTITIIFNVLLTFLQIGNNCSHWHHFRKCTEMMKFFDPHAIYFSYLIAAGIIFNHWVSWLCPVPFHSNVSPNEIVLKCEMPLTRFQSIQI